MDKSFLVILAPECFCYLLKDLIPCSFGPTWYLLCVLHLSSSVFARPNLSMTLSNTHPLERLLCCTSTLIFFSILRLVLFHSYQMQETEYLESSPYSPPSKTLESSFYLHSSPKLSNVELYKILYLMM